MTRRKLSFLVLVFGGAVVTLCLPISPLRAFGVVCGMILIAAAVVLDPPPGPDE